MADSGQGAVGQLGITDANSQFNAQSFQHHQMLGRIGTTKLVKIIKVHPGQNGAAPTVDVQILVNMVDGAGNSTPHGTTYGLQIWRAQNGTAAVVMDPVAGDIGVAMICDRDISGVVSKKGAANPGSGRRFDPSDGIYLGGSINGAPKMSIAMVPGTNSDGSGGTVTINDGNKNIWTMNSSGISLSVTSGTGTLAIQGGLTVTNDVVAGQGGSNQISLQQHLHQNAGGSGNSGAPVAGT